MDLNSEQQEAVEHINGPALVIAGAGSGKTRVVTCRISHLLESGILPGEILGVTFTNKAAKEMKLRVEKQSHQRVMISTFHSLGARILRESIHHLGYKNQFTIYDEDDADKLLKHCIKDVGADIADIKTYRRLISEAKNLLLAPEEIDRSQYKRRPESFFPDIYTLYQKRLKECEAVDFDDLLFVTVKLFEKYPEVLEAYQQRWKYLLVDEYQDTNHAQYEMCRLLVEKTQNLFVVGDPDQSIYSWRGAEISNILNFEKDYPGAKVIRLEQNYRSTSNILNAANTLVAHNYNRYEKELWSDLGEGATIKILQAEDERHEAQFVAERLRYHHEHDGIPYNDMVVFYRTNAQSRPFEDQLLTRHIPYVIVGGISFYQRKEIKDILALLRLVQSPSDIIAFNRMINVPKRGLGETTLNKIREAASAEALPVLTYCDALVSGHSLENQVRLSAKQKAGLCSFVELIRRLNNVNANGLLSDLVTVAIKESGYQDFLNSDPETADERLANLNELIGKAIEWEEMVDDADLSGFLEELSLKSSLDEAADDEERINLMTLHNGKGLEFRVAFVVGLEEDLLPHVNSRRSSDALEEERRLFYVGMTRAKEHLYLTHALVRFLRGQRMTQRRSRFLVEVPSKYVEKVRLIPEYQEQLDAMERIRKPVAVEPIAFEVGEQLKPGDRVFHQEFGIGIIQESYEGAAGLTYSVLFNNLSRPKKLVAKYAALQRL
ncbi:MAG: UvrD-helicase domain-containing protein [Chlamydiales bacterium]|nr:UvrD-helicase domain-containing protein [Chlamydiales bacterium]